MGGSVGVRVWGGGGGGLCGCQYGCLWVHISTSLCLCFTVGACSSVSVNATSGSEGSSEVIAPDS